MKKLKECLLECSLRERRIIHNVLLGVAMFLVVLGWCSYNILVILGILVLFLMLVYNLLAFRCPACRAYLGMHMIGFSHCPKCGKPLNE